jgi:hypothetical protein
MEVWDDDAPALHTVEPAPPRLRIVATTAWHRPTCLVLWRGQVWGGGEVPTFVSETRARLSVASEVTRLVERGLN